MSGLLLNNYFYIARDEDNGLWGYQEKPKQLETMYELLDTKEDSNIVSLNDDLFQQIQFGNILDIKFELSQVN